MSRLPLAFLVAAAACMVCGVALGIAMGIAHDFQLAPVHAHVNLLGWTSLALMGLTLRAWPELAAGPLAVTQFALSTSSALCFPAGIYLSIVHEAPQLAILAALVWFAGALLFLARLAWLLLAGASHRAPMALPAE